MSKKFLAVLAGLATVAVVASTPAARQDSAVRTYASNAATHGGSLIIRTNSDLSGYMVAVG